MAEKTSQKERRKDSRGSLSGTVTVRFAPEALAGEGQNISAEGALFVLGASVPLTIEVAGDGRARKGVLVRASDLGGGKIGMAVRFV